MTLEERLQKLRDEYLKNPTRRKLIEAQARCIKRAIERRDGIDKYDKRIYPTTNDKVSGENGAVSESSGAVQGRLDGQGDIGKTNDGFDTMLSILESSGTPLKGTN